MKNAKLQSTLFGVLFVLLLTAAVLLSFSFRNSAPIVIGSTDSADVRTEALMEALCHGDYAAAEDLLSGAPELDIDRELSTPLGKLLWEAYTVHFSYEFDGSTYLTDYGVYRDVTVTILDIPALMNDLQARSATMLAGKAANADSAYDKTGSYRPKFIAEALAESAEEMLNEKDYLTQRTITLQLTSRHGKWLIASDQALMDLIAGGMGGV